MDIEEFINRLASRTDAMNQMERQVSDGNGDYENKIFIRNARIRIDDEQWKWEFRYVDEYKEKAFQYIKGIWEDLKYLGSKEYIVPRTNPFVPGLANGLGYWGQLAIVTEPNSNRFDDPLKKDRVIKALIGLMIYIGARNPLFIFNEIERLEDEYKDLKKIHLGFTIYPPDEEDEGEYQSDRYELINPNNILIESKVLNDQPRIEYVSIFTNTADMIHITPKEILTYWEWLLQMPSTQSLHLHRFNKYQNRVPPEIMEPIIMSMTRSSSTKTRHELNKSFNEYNQRTVKTLKEDLKERGLSTTGNKSVLIDRLLDSDYLI